MFRVKFDTSQVTRTLAEMFGGGYLRDILRRGARTVVYNLSAYIAQRAKTRHKTAKRLRATPTGILEFTAARQNARSKYGGLIHSRFKGNNELTVYISNIPFIQKAYHPLIITPKKAKALTIPVHKDAYAKRASDVANLYFKTYVRKGKGAKHACIMGVKSPGSRPVALYVLLKRTKVKQDPTLMPKNDIMTSWFSNEVERAMMEGLGDG